MNMSSLQMAMELSKKVQEQTMSLVNEQIIQA